MLIIINRLVHFCTADLGFISLTFGFYLHIYQTDINLLRKEVIQPHLPVRLPCYDFTPIIGPTLDGCFLAVSPPVSGMTNFRGVTGGVYKARERIQRSVLIYVY